MVYFENLGDPWPVHNCGAREFTCSACFTLRRFSQLVDKRKMLCADCT